MRFLKCEKCEKPMLWHFKGKCPPEEIKLSTRTCLRCGRIWTLRQPKEPIVCPKCKSPYWNKNKTEEKTK